MKSFARIARIAIALVLLSTFYLNPAMAQGLMSDFEGRWTWAIYADDKNELPPAYRNMPLKDVPEYSLELDIKQLDNKIIGRYRSTWRYLSKLEEGEFSATVKGNKAYLKLESGFGGKVYVKLTRENRYLHWKVVKETGENYFHNDVCLSKIKR